MVNHVMLDCPCEQNFIAALKVKITVKVKNFHEGLSGQYIQATEPFVTSMVMHHHGTQCHVKRLVWYLQGHGHSEGSCYQI